MNTSLKILLATGGLSVVPGVARAQTPPATPEPPHVYYACYQQSAGIVYRIREPGLPTECRGNHIMFSWSETGTPGPAGAPGLACWDTNGNGVADPAEDTNKDGVWDAKDCAGPAGAPGAAGRACWDLNGNGTPDLPAEDKNGDGVVNALDCQGFPTGTAASGDLGGTYPGPTVLGLRSRPLADVAPMQGQALVYDGPSNSWMPGTANVSGTAGGDLGGTYPSPSVERLHGNLVSNAVPTTGQVLTFNGTMWVPAAALQTYRMWTNVFVGSGRRNVFASCSSGYLVMSAGFWAVGTDLAVLGSLPDGDTGWVWSVNNPNQSGTIEFQGSLLCAKFGP